MLAIWLTVAVFTVVGVAVTGELPLPPPPHAANTTNCPIAHRLMIPALSPLGSRKLRRAAFVALGRFEEPADDRRGVSVAGVDGVDVTRCVNPVPRWPTRFDVVAIGPVSSEHARVPMA
jgi:hypothetical protein